ncbi:MAG: M1 family metallopeptidase [Acidimicrobiia bacterium]
MSENPYRLPRTVVPHRYRLRLEPDLESFTFTGSERIDVTVETITNEITLNAADLEISSAELTRADGTIGASARPDGERERVTLVLETPAEPGDWELRIDFNGTLNDYLRGFYRSRFTDVDGNEQVIATTQFESTDARRAFPCWDEPDFKAVFETTLVIPSDLMAVTNTAEKSRKELDDGRTEITFDETMKMSTYLVAFVVGPFEATDPVDVDGVPTRIVVPRGKLHLADYAMDCAQFCFRYLRDYYGIDYPGDKLDHIAIPDFAFGAMENVGAITYRETALLIDPARASQAEKLRILDVIGHEIAHQWFGNLVTMGWWEGVWLNEAFASFMEMKATDARRPEWKRWLNFAAVERPWAFGVDQLASTRPVEFEVNSPAEADEMFDALTYGKGSSVLRMLEQFIGEQAFRDGVGTYLRRHAFGNAITADLWAGLDSTAKWPVAKMMDGWIHQRGFPKLSVESVPGGLRIAQQRYLAIPDDADQTQWQVPIRLRGIDESGDRFERTLLLEDEETTVDTGPTPWVTANAGGHGFYRVHYAPDLFDALVTNLSDLEAVERYGLLNDTDAFLVSGEENAATVLELLDAYREETEQPIWQLILGILTEIEHHLIDDEDLERYREFCRGLLRPVAVRLGWEPQPDEDDLTRRLRGQILGALGGRPGLDPETIARAEALVDEVLAGTSDLDPEILRAVLAIVPYMDVPDTYERVWAGYERNDSPAEQLRFLQTLSRFDDPDLARHTLDATLDGSIRNQDGASVVALLFGNRYSGPAVWAEARRRWDELLAVYPPMSHRRLVEGIPSLSRPDVAADVQAFFAETPMAYAAKATAQKLELLEAFVETNKRESPGLTAWLRARFQA